MRCIHFIGLGVMALSLSLAAPAHSQFEPAGLSAVEQAAVADLIVIGKVIDLEPEPVLVERAKGNDRAVHLVATIRVEENLLGAEGLTHVRVAFIPEFPRPPRTAQNLFL